MHWNKREYAEIVFTGPLAKDVTLSPDGLEVEVPAGSWPESGGRIAPADISKWAEPPHLALANWQMDASGVKKFIETYGFFTEWEQAKDFQLPAPNQTQRVLIKIDKVQEKQQWFRDHWAVPADLARFALRPDRIYIADGRAKLAIKDLGRYTYGLFFLDMSADRLAVCPNPKCNGLKYFIKERSNQKFCSNHCKNAFHFFNWLGDEVNRDEWNAARRNAKKSKRKRI